VRALPGIDFFDLDYTLLAGFSGVEFLLRGIRRGVFPILSSLFVPLYFIRYRFGLINPEAEAFSFSVLRGRTREELDGLAQESFRLLKAKVYPEARELIAACHANGRLAVLATSSIQIAVMPLARELALDEVIASALEFEGERCTGRFREPPLLGERKKAEVLAYLRDQHVDPADCSFHTDSISDLPLLEAVGWPVAVNPDPRLRRIARRRGWPLLRFTSP
jgi:putative phosphoserine phosphatase/1-acylglycerol-3-phosphate O-acyltransferase